MPEISNSLSVSSIELERRSGSFPPASETQVAPASDSQVPDGGYGWVVVFGCAVLSELRLSFRRKIIITTSSLVVRWHIIQLGAHAGLACGIISSLGLTCAIGSARQGWSFFSFNPIIRWLLGGCLYIWVSPYQCQGHPIPGGEKNGALGYLPHRAGRNLERICDAEHRSIICNYGRNYGDRHQVCETEF